MPTPTLRELQAHLRRESLRLLNESVEADLRGDHEQARRLRATLEGLRQTAEEAGLWAQPPSRRELEILTFSKRLDSLREPMTKESLNRRRVSIAKAAAKGDPLLEKISHDTRYGSAAAYARKRLRVSPASFSQYKTGRTACPRPVADKVAEDFGFPATVDTWPGGVTD